MGEEQVGDGVWVAQFAIGEAVPARIGDQKVGLATLCLHKNAQLTCRMAGQTHGDDTFITKKIDAMATRGGELAKFL